MRFVETYIPKNPKDLRSNKQISRVEAVALVISESTESHSQGSKGISHLLLQIDLHLKLQPKYHPGATSHTGVSKTLFLVHPGINRM